MGIAPDWGLRRVRARAAADVMKRHYEAAAAGRRTSGWRRWTSDANAANAPALPALRELSRDLRRNNGWARRGIQAIVNNTVGWGIEAKAVASTPDMAAQALNTWQRWAYATSCDYDGRLPFSGGLQRLVLETIAESGEALVIREVASTADALASPVRIRVVEPDYLDSTRDAVAPMDSNPIVSGIEFDRRGRRLAYWIHDHHPGGNFVAGTKYESRRVLAEDVLHIYKVDRPGQARGVPWLTAAIARLSDLDDYEDARLMQQKIAACFGAFVQDYDGAGAAIGEESTEDDRIETLEPGHIAYLPPGKSITFATPPGTTDHASFTSVNLRRVAAALGVTYEDLTGDYSQVNFSSARMGRLAHWANVEDWRWNMLIPQLCDGVWRWVMKAAAEVYGWHEVPTAEWAPPPMPMLEPEKEGLAYTRLVRGGFRTLPQVWRELGEDPESMLKEIAASNTELDRLKIWLDSDPRRVSAAGLTQERVGAGAGGSAPDES
jgi:lambda family phage portal protein